MPIINGKQKNESLGTNFYMLFAGQLVSAFGNNVFDIAILLYVKQLTESATTMGFFRMLSLLPIVLLGPLSGSIADRFNRKTIIILSDTVNGLVMIGIGFIGFFSLSKGVPLAVIYLCAVTVGFMNVFFSPAVESLIPELVPSEKLQKAYGIRSVGFDLIELGGSSLGAVLFGLLGGPLIFLFNGITFLLSALQECFIFLPKEAKHRSRVNRKPFWSETKLGIKYVVSDKGVRSLFVVLMVCNFFLPAIIIGMPFYISNILLLPEAYYGYLLGVSGLGMALGSFIMVIWKLSSRIRKIVFNASYPLMGLIILSAAFKPPVLILFILFFIDGIIISVAYVIQQTVLVEGIDPGIRGRVFGILSTISGVLAPFSYVLSGLLIDTLGNSVINLLYVIFSVYMVLSVYIIGNKEIKLLFNRNISRLG